MFVYLIENVRFVRGFQRFAHWLLHGCTDQEMDRGQKKENKGEQEGQVDSGDEEAGSGASVAAVVSIEAAGPLTTHTVEQSENKTYKDICFFCIEG